MKSIFYFTDEDPRQLPKSSRDPLRFQPVWGAVARQMIPNLTTVTPSYRGFLTRFLFHGLLEDIAPELANGSAEEQWKQFSKFEQLCAFVRHEVEPSTKNIPGISGIPGRLNNGYVEITSDSTLIASQKNTGFWGYYHQSCINSKIIKTSRDSGYRLTDEAFEAYKNSYEKQKLMSLKEQLTQLFESKKQKINLLDFKPIAEIFADKPLKNNSPLSNFWFENLLKNGRYDGLFAKKIKDNWNNKTTVNGTSQFNFGAFWNDLAFGDDDVSKFAKEVQSTEAVIGLCEWVFDICRLNTSQDKPLSDVAKDAIKLGYTNTWLDKLHQYDEPEDKALKEYRTLATFNSFEELAKVLIERHENIMEVRKSAPWVKLDDSTGQLCLKIKEFSNERKLSENQGIIWRYDYLLKSWVSVAIELGYLSEFSDG